MMDVKTPMKKMLMDEDMDSAIYFLDAKVRDKRLSGPIGVGTTTAKLLK